MINNVVFDFGQVLVRFDPMYMTKQYIDNDADAKLVADVLFDRAYWDRLDAGTITDEEVVRLSCERLPKRLHESAEKVYYNWIYNLPEIEGMRELIIKLKKAGKRVYLLSNISEYFAAHAHEIPILALLDGCVFSAECGMTKPNREIFVHICEKFGLDPTETVFVDDREDNVQAAMLLGMAGYVFDGDADKLRTYLDSLFA